MVIPARTRLRFALSSTPPAAARRGPNAGQRMSSPGSAFASTPISRKAGISSAASAPSPSALRSSVAPTVMKKMGMKKP